MSFPLTCSVATLAAALLWLGTRHHLGVDDARALAGALWVIIVAYKLDRKLEADR